MRSLLSFLKPRSQKNRTIRLTVGMVLIALLLPIILITLFKPSKSEASWFDETWLYRTTLSFTHNASASNTKVKFDIDTSTLITAGKMQSDCGDSRFTDVDGKVLPYYLDSAGGACNTNSTDYYVLIPNISSGTNIVYHYYGNPTVTNGTETAQFDQSTTSPSGGAATTGTEEKSLGPVIYYKMDEGSDNSCSGGTNDVCDSRGTTIDGAVTNDPLRQNRDNCISGSCLYFDSVDGDAVTTTQTSAINLSDQLTNGFTFSAWIRPNGAGEGTGGQVFYKGTNSWLRVDTLSSGNLDLEASLDLATTDATVNVSTAVKSDQWTHVAVSYTDDADDEITLWVNGVAVGSSTNGVGSPASDTNNLIIGGTTTNNFNGFIDEFKIYDYERSSAQMVSELLQPGSTKGNSAVAANPNTLFMTRGLVGYWNMNERVGDTCPHGLRDNCDSSGERNEGLWVGGATAAAGKISNGTTYDGSGDYVQIADSTSLSPTSTVSIAVWVKPNSSIATKALVIKDVSYRLVTDGSGNPICQIYSGGAWQTGATSSVALSVSSWQFVGCSYDGATMSVSINGVVTGTTSLTNAINDSTNELEIGRDGGGTYGDYNGTMDEVRIYSRALTIGEMGSIMNFSPAPVGYWKMDEQSGTNTADGSGNGNPGTLTNGPTWQLGKVGGSVRFDGTDDEVGLGTNENLQVPLPATIEAWIYPETGTTLGGIFANDATVGNGHSGVWMDSFTDTGNLLLSAGFGTGLGGGSTNRRDCDSAVALTKNAWTHVTTVIRGAADITFYINGVKETPVSCGGTGGSIGYGANPAKIGNRIGTFWTGRIDEVKLYNYERTSSQITEDMVMTSPQGANSSSQIVYWKFDEQNGNTINNSGFGGTTQAGTNTSGGAQWLTSSTCKINGCLNFDTSTDTVTAGDVAFVNGLSGFSASFWINPQTLATDRSILTKNDSSQRSFAIVTDSSTSSEIRVHIAASVSEAANTTYCVTSGLGLTASTWQHIAVVYDGTQQTATDRVKVYKNGYSVACGSNGGTFPTSMTTTSTSNLKVGDDDSATYSSLLAYIDDVKMYTGALSGDQVKADASFSSTINFGTGQNEATQITGSAETAPVLNWPLNENTGTTATDISGNANDGTLTNSPTWTLGRYGSAVDFAGSNQHITRADDADLDFGAGGSFTIETWFKHAVASSQELIVSKYNEAGYKLIMESDGDITCGIDYDSTWSPTDSVTSTAATYDDGLWHHITCVKNANTSLTLYIDGVSVGTPDTSLTNSTLANSDPIYYGIDADGTSNDFIGQLDNLVIYNYARSQAQVSYDYNRGAPLAWYKFDDCTGATTYDASGNGFSGTTAGTSGSNTGNGTCTTVDSAAKWYNGRSGKYNNSLSFDGTDDTVSVTDTAALRFDANTQDFSLFAWIKKAANGSEMNILSKEDADDDGYRLEFTSGNLVRCSVNATDITSSDTITDTEWHLVGCTVTRAGNGQVYIDGKTNGSATAISSSTMATTANITIGARAYSTANYFNGQIDDIKLFNYALTQTQINKVFNEGASVRFGPLSGTPAP